MDTVTLALSLFMVGATIADTETTISALRNGGRELNPVMAPFSNSRAGLYTAKGAVGLGVGVLSHKLRRSPRRHEKVIGWALPVLYIGAQGVAARHNARLR